MTTHTKFRIYHSRSNSWDTNEFDNEVEAINHATKKTICVDPKDSDYWNNQDNVVEKVTTTIEVVTVIKPVDRN